MAMVLKHHTKHKVLQLVEVVGKVKKTESYPQITVLKISLLMRFSFGGTSVSYSVMYIKTRYAFGLYIHNRI